MVLVSVFCFSSYSNATPLGSGDCSTDNSTNFITGTNCANSTQSTTEIFNSNTGAGFNDMTRTGATSIITDWNGYDEIWFQHTQDSWAVQIAITTALANAGINVDGYTASWEVFNRHTNTINGACSVAKTNGECIDPLTITLSAKDSNGNSIHSQTFDYSAMNTHNIDPYKKDPHWYEESVLSWVGSEQLTPGSGIASVDIVIAGYDAGYWSGNYGPRVKNMVGSLILSVDICASTPLHSPSCPGYATAFATQQYNTNCAASATYDPGCPGYGVAFQNEQCITNPMPHCPGFVAEEVIEVVVSAETIAEPSVTGDSIIDSILAETVIEPNVSLYEPNVGSVVAAPVQEPIIIEAPIEPVNTASEQLEVSIELEIEEEAIEVVVVEEITEDGSEEEPTIVKAPTPEKVITKKQKTKAKAKKIKEIVQARGESLAQQMSVAATVEVQKQLQNQLIAIIGFVPDFSKYGKTNIDGGTLQQEVNLKGGRIVDHQYSRWFLNDPKFSTMENSQYPSLRSN